METTTSSLPPVNAKDSSVADLISQSFPKFDHRGTIVEPFDNEGRRDTEFQDKLSKMIIELMLELHAWSTSRPTQESDSTADTLEKEINGIMETEKEQGRSLSLSASRKKTRQRLNDFVNRIKMALAALTGL
ncbi:hypothetical protein BC835DRAFT_1262355 [Cytidiella melzeri]|nr:hypothetical protein BC835DRAFT_1262355 [Cytidiella melzeri]